MKVLEAAHDRVRADRVDVPERPASKWWKAEPEDSADVAIPCRPEDAFLQTEHGFVHHSEYAALGDLVRGNLRPVLLADDSVNGLIDGALLTLFVISIE